MNDSRAYQSRAGMNVIFVHSELDDRELSSAAFRVYCHLARRAGQATAFPGIDSMARVCNLAGKTVIKSIRELEAQGMIQTDKRAGQTTRYILTPASDWAERGKVANASDPETVVNELTPRGKVANATVVKERTKGNPTKVIQEGEPSAAAAAREFAKKQHAQFIKLWTEGYAEEFERAYVFGGAKDASAVKRLLAATKELPEDLVAVAHVAWRNTHLFNCKQAVTIAGLASRWNDILAELEKLNLLPKTALAKPVAGVEKF